ncbi:PREDICTED: glycylpeptide N-tetradecanoyltransferase 2 [Colobus angolensis palliatus]|uniref:glycylpeptide N-tetradecanoyltransferase 2 n=1 Tax=Colobus angolensis palliatus TaxID=336983 RepID=UPI0005F48394|nr:PREDICTED: glycylpeptide N-tetradecanoyltransferase 2 [Colobus angolensis palliatus]
MQRRRSFPAEVLEGVWEPKRKRRNRREKRRNQIPEAPSQIRRLIPRRLKFSSLRNTTPSGSRFQREQPWNPSVPMEKLQDIQRAMELLSACQGPARNIDEAARHRYQFWDTQPVPKLEKNYLQESKNRLVSEEVNVEQKRFHGTRELGKSSPSLFLSVKKMVEINFLCVHKKLRSKRVAPVLIREITRRVNLEGIFQAVYTAGVVLPKPVATCRYQYHVSTSGPPFIKHVEPHHCSSRSSLLVTKTSGLRPMEPKDIKSVRELINTYLKQFHLAPVMDEEEVAHWFLPREHIIDTFVVESPNGKLTDFLSFYTLPSTVMHHPAHKSLKAAYSFYNIHTETPLLDLMSDALILAKSVTPSFLFMPFGSPTVCAKL